jgi:hypothetical protein
MTQIFIVLAAAALIYFFFGGLTKLVGGLGSMTLKVRGFQVPALFVIFLSFVIAVAVWMLFKTFGIKTAAVAGLVTIEAVAFYSMNRGGNSNRSASLWLINAFALGSLFILCIALLA